LESTFELVNSELTFELVNSDLTLEPVNSELTCDSVVGPGCCQWHSPGYQVRNQHVVGFEGEGGNLQEGISFLVVSVVLTHESSDQLVTLSSVPHFLVVCRRVSVCFVPLMLAHARRFGF
jgi:hypothetical protein